MLLCLVKISSVGVNMEMPHWSSAIICNAVCRLKRELKSWQPKNTNGKPKELLAVDSQPCPPVLSGEWAQEAPSWGWRPRHAHPVSSQTGHCHFLCTWKNNKCGDFILEGVRWSPFSGCERANAGWANPLWDGLAALGTEDVAAPLLAWVCVFLRGFGLFSFQSLQC